MAKRQALGRGLASLIPDDEEELAPGRGERHGIREVETERIDPGPYQPRKTFEDETLEELARSVGSNGLLQPLVVRARGERYQLICGERRLRAARKADLRRVPVVVKDATDSEALELALVENVQREDLNAIELAAAFERLQREFGYTQEEVAQRVGMDRSSVANHLRLLRLPEEARSAVAAGVLSMGHARALLALEDPLLSEALKRVLSRRLSVRETESLVRRLKRGTGVPSGGGAEHEAADVELSAVATKLQRRFQTQVRIRRSKNGGGEIRIRYYSREELDRILDLMPVE